MMEMVISRICSAVEKEDRNEIVGIIGELQASESDQTPTSQAADSLLDKAVAPFCKQAMKSVLELSLTINREFGCGDEDSTDFETLAVHFQRSGERSMFFAGQIWPWGRFSFPDDSAVLSGGGPITAVDLAHVVPKMVARYPHGSVGRSVLELFATEVVALLNLPPGGAMMDSSWRGRKMVVDIARTINGNKNLVLGCYQSEPDGVARVWPILQY